MIDTGFTPPHSPKWNTNAFDFTQALSWRSLEERALGVERE